MNDKEATENNQTPPTITPAQVFPAKKPRGRPFVKGDPRIQPNMKGRTAGYKTFQAELIATLMDSTVSDTDQRPFMLAALEKYKHQVLTRERSLDDFASKMFTNPEMLDKIDNLLNGQKKNDLKYLKYQIYERCFNEQQEVLNSKSLINVLVCGRRAGKTETLASKIAQQAIAPKLNAEGIPGDIIYIARTFKSAKKIIWKTLLQILRYVNASFTSTEDGIIKMANGCQIYIVGGGTIDDIENIRGQKYQLAVIDEAQSLRYSRYMINEVLLPLMKDYKAQLYIAGTPPRAKDNYLETLWADPSPHVAKFHWDMDSNVVLEDYPRNLAEELKRYSLKETDPVWQREFLGLMGVYDTDAQVFKQTAQNILDVKLLTDWINSNNPKDLFFSSGLDLGWNDSNAFCIILASSSKPEKWIVYEHKKNEEMLGELAGKIRQGLKIILEDPLYRAVPNRDSIPIYVDTGGGGKTSYMELKRQYNLNCFPAIKREGDKDKNIFIDILREEVRLNRLIYRNDGYWYDEIDKIIYERNENDQIIKEIDHDAFHPDFMDCVLYAMRPIWNSTKIGVGETYVAPPEPEPYHEPDPWDSFVRSFETNSDLVEVKPGRF